ncbi:hypothetical protein [Sphingomonas carotinifaciens]|uniref:Uncharacterized protein n=1 Tax=Sphingomonas carotinifaciens TaxID=1166323 RepID=A0A1G7PPC2_9SPHN|nr:hypothetical protein [Sphingomonas carotinifaciens]MBB4087446.1 hypothetical protein [Sphingomonas carotinifaciens]MWC45717.1 hypothetical protein [Sphingomonas carotinifaciens]SDF88107.1 hypothetical protein SAMN05216557_10721 [Sphingomonas carotinifaciens]
MNEVELTVEVTAPRDAGGRDLVTDHRSRVFKVPLHKSCIAQAWGTQRFNAAMDDAGDDEVVKVEITGRSEDASHHLAAGRMLGWSGKVQARNGVFVR